MDKKEIEIKIKCGMPPTSGHITDIEWSNRSMGIYKENDIHWLQCVTFVDGPKNRVEEFLICEDEKNQIFRLTHRIAHGKVSTMMLAARHRLWPVTSLMKMRD
jgi:hypothetical protein